MIIELHPFSEEDIPRLIGWVPDARFLLQWAGPKYHFPLDTPQLLATLHQATGDKPPHFLFKAVRSLDRVVVGHVELMQVDYKKRTAILGRVLIGEPAARGHGLGAAMVAEAVDFAFREISLDEVALRVFDFNRSAIACYDKLGFADVAFEPAAWHFGDESWNLIRMTITKQRWLELRSPPV